MAATSLKKSSMCLSPESAVAAGAAAGGGIPASMSPRPAPLAPPCTPPGPFCTCLAVTPAAAPARAQKGIGRGGAGAAEAERRTRGACWCLCTLAGAAQLTTTVPSKSFMPRSKPLSAYWQRLLGRRERLYAGAGAAAGGFLQFQSTAARTRTGLPGACLPVTNSRAVKRLAP